MELREFIAKTLQEMIAGVKDAQAYAEKVEAFINPNMSYVNASHSPTMLFTYQDGENQYIAQMVEFDIAITVTDEDKGKGGIGILPGVIGIGVQAEISQTHNKDNRVKFTVPVMLPIQKSVPQSPDSLVIGENPISDYRG